MHLPIVLTAATVFRTDAAVSLACMFDRGKPYVHGERAFRLLSDNSFEVTSVHTKLIFSPYNEAETLDVVIVHSQLTLSTADRAHNQRTTEHIVKTRVDYSIDPVTCEIEFGDAWFGVWSGKRFRYTGDLSRAGSVIQGEMEHTFSNANIQNNYVLRLFNRLKPIGGKMETFSAKIVNDSILFGSTSGGGVVLTNAVPGTAVMRVLRDEYRRGTGVGNVDLSDVARALDREKFATQSLLGLSSTSLDVKKANVACEAILVGGTAYTYTTRAVRSVSSEESQIVSVHVVWKTQDRPDKLDLELVLNTVTVSRKSRRHTETSTEYLTLNAVAVTIDPLTCRLSLSSTPNFNGWTVRQYLVQGDLRVVRDSAGTVVSVKGESVISGIVRMGSDPHLLSRIAATGPAITSASDGLSAFVVRGRISVSNREGVSAFMLKPSFVVSGAAQIAKLIENYRSGVEEGMVDEALLDIVFANTNAEWQPLPSV